jgi:hypothetical protein
LQEIKPFILGSFFLLQLKRKEAFGPMCVELRLMEPVVYDVIKKKMTPRKKRENIMGQTELLEDTAPELDELEMDEPDLDDFGDDELDELDGLSSDLDRWGEDDYDSYNSDRNYLYGLLR